MSDLKELVDKVLDELELESVTGATNRDSSNVIGAQNLIDNYYKKGGSEEQLNLAVKLLRAPQRPIPVFRKGGG